MCREGSGGKVNEDHLLLKAQGREGSRAFMVKQSVGNETKQSYEPMVPKTQLIKCELVMSDGVLNNVVSEVSNRLRTF